MAGRQLERRHQLVPAAKIRAVPGSQDSEVFTSLGRLVPGYAEAVAKLRSRINPAPRLTAQRFRDRCGLFSPASQASPR